MSISINSNQSMNHMLSNGMVEGDQRRRTQAAASSASISDGAVAVALGELSNKLRKSAMTKVQALGPEATPKETMLAQSALQDAQVIFSSSQEAVKNMHKDKKDAVTNLR
ncbi:hypothetical protein [Dyella sp.]|uniref:hypothetical protein n=1 Tax=Dyella sp. TaxID=1869338 RepID=UPI002ED18115